jgi:homoserine dehydrogenase
MIGLKETIPDEKDRYKMIVEECLYFSDINSTNIFICKLLIDPYNEYKLNYNEGNTLELDIKEKWNIEGFDAAAKAAILSGLAFHTRVTVSDVYREGISHITLEDVAIAKSMGHVIKLLAIAELTPADEISVRVHPVMIDKSHPLASVRDAFNAVFIEAESAGPLMFYGRGAGGQPTASAILGDVVAVSRHIALNSIGQRETDYADRNIAPIETTKTKFLIRLEVEDKSGVLAAIAQVFANQGVSIQTVDQNGRDKDAELIIVTHRATEGELTATVEALKKMEMVTKISSVIRVEGAIS